MIQQFEICQKKWSRVLVLRFDLHTPVNSPTNSAVTEFRKKLVERLKWNYGLKEVGFCWVREQEKAKSQHYHFALFLDGDCSGQLIPDTGLDRYSAFAGGAPSLN